MLCGEHRHARRGRRHRLVADELVYEIRRLPRAIDVDARIETEAAERRRRRLRRHTMERERERIDGAGDEVGAGPRRLERGCKGHPAGALAVEADRETRGVADGAHEVGRTLRG